MKSLIKELGLQVKVGNKTWQQSADEFNEQTGMNLSSEALRKRYANLKNDTTYENVTNDREYDKIMAEIVRRGFNIRIDDDYICNIPTELEHNISMGDILNMDEIQKKFTVLKDDNSSKEIKFKEPVLFKIELEDDTYYYSNNKYKIFSYGQTQEEAESQLYKCFYKKYELFSNVPDEKLDSKAIELKYNLKSIFED